MLIELQIRDFAIIETLRLGLGPGLNVLTGETGAGKSIVVDALGALMGARLGSEVVRTGAGVALVEGIVQVPPRWLAENREALGAILTDAGLEPDGDSLILTREVQRGGRSIARIDGRAVPLRLLQQVGHLLLDIHGQGEQQSLTRVGLHRDLLDGYAGLVPQRRQVAERVAELTGVRQGIDRLRQEERELARRLGLLSFQVNEIDDARLQPGEQGELERERLILANAEKLAAAAATVHQALAEGTEEQAAALDMLGTAGSSLSDAVRLDPSLEDALRSLEEARYQIEDVARTLRTYGEAVEADPERLEALEERLHLIGRLRRKYGDTIEDILEFGERARAEMEGLTNREEQLAELEKRGAALLREIGSLAAALSEARQAASARLAAAVQGELAELGMGKARFQVAVQQDEAEAGVKLPDGRCCRFDAGGVDRVEFLIAPNPGEPLLPLAKIASGGELARTMLALKTVLAQADATPTLVFDEVDSGVGARGGDVVGRKLWSLGEQHQILCVSHLPQVAAYADAHYRVVKTTIAVAGAPAGTAGAERTNTSVCRLSAEERVEEVAAMLGGREASQLTHMTASELLDQAQEWKGQAAGERDELRSSA